LSIAGDVSTETVKLYLFGLPLVLAGTWTAQALRPLRRRGFSANRPAVVAGVRHFADRACLDLSLRVHLLQFRI
jgi:hypothetical protein